jgi:hypothetical protein
LDPTGGTQDFDIVVDARAGIANPGLPVQQPHRVGDARDNPEGSLNDVYDN